MLELLKNRRSIRKYTSKLVEKEKIDLVLQAALLSPSSKKKQPWEFLLITERDIITKLAYSKEAGAAFAKEAPVVILVMADETRSDVWVEDASIASTLIHLQAHSLGLGSCWIQLRNRSFDQTKSTEAYIREVLSIPENIKIEAMISIGYPAEEKEAYSEKDLRWDKVFVNQYGKSIDS